MFGFLILILIYPATGLLSNLQLDFTRNACPSWFEYNSRSLNNQCRHNPDVEGELEPLATNKGYKIETYQVITEDGYNLTLFHVVNTTAIRRDDTVLVQHGIYMNPIGWTLTGKDSLAFVLADAGYDVWLGSSRGTRYTSHITLKDTDKAYWDFTPHEMGRIDLPASIDMVRSNNGNQSVTLLTFSMSSTAALIYTSTMPDHAKANVKRQVNMAPVAYLDDIKSILGKLRPLYSFIIKPILALFGQYKLLTPSSQSKQISESLFLTSTFNVQFYRHLMGSIFGLSCQLNSETLAATVLNGGDSICVRVIDFFAQIMKTGIFQAFDYGSNADNLKHYNSTTPPIYNVSTINIPTTLVYAENDAIATNKNVIHLYNELPPETCLIKVSLPEFSHQDFVNGKYVSTILYKYLVDDYLQGTCTNGTATNILCSSIFLE